MHGVVFEEAVCGPKPTGLDGILNSRRQSVWDRACCNRNDCCSRLGYFNVSPETSPSFPAEHLLLDSVFVFSPPSGYASFRAIRADVPEVPHVGIVGEASNASVERNSGRLRYVAVVGAAALMPLGLGSVCCRSRIQQAGSRIGELAQVLDGRAGDCQRKEYKKGDFHGEYFCSIFESASTMRETKSEGALWHLYVEVGIFSWPSKYGFF